MSNTIESRVLEIVQASLREASQDIHLELNNSASMENIAQWDSLSFMVVFSAINTDFQINPDFDDAVNYTSIASICEYLGKITT